VTATPHGYGQFVSLAKIDRLDYILAGRAADN
jgi:hypothetical protein